MKVIQGGTVPAPEDWVVKVTCIEKRVDKGAPKGCGAELEVNKDDVVLMKWFGTHSAHYYAAVQCPRCLKYNFITAPNTIWKELNTPEGRAKAIFDGFDDSI